VMYLQWYKKDY